MRLISVLSDNTDVQLSFVSTRDIPALQFFDCIDFNSVADRSGIKSGDFLLEVGYLVLFQTNNIFYF